jgi:gliding motility-associated-like protein
VVTISGTPTASGVFNYTVNTTGGCPPASTTGTITVTPQNTIAVGTSQTVCINTAIAPINLATTGATGATFTGLPAGVTGSWAGNVVTISGTPTASGVFNYTVNTTGGCPPASTTGTITVTPQNTIAVGTSQTVCINTAIAPINLATTGATGATFTGLPAGVTGSWAGNVVTISGTPTASGVFNYTVNTTGGCPPASTTGTITVTPQNTIAVGTSQTVCINTAIAPINLATTGATGATFTGLPAGVTGSWAGNVVTISGTPTASGVFNYTVNTTGGCPPASTTGTITVTPQNTIAVGTSQTVCINTAIAPINLATTGATGATFTGLPAGVTGSWAGNVVTISGTPTASGVFNYTVNTTGGCPPASTTGTITVTPQNTIAVGTSQTVCINTAIAPINLATTGATGATFTGLPAGVTGSWAGNVVTISGTPTASGVFNYTVNTTGGCPPASTTGTITVTPQNTIAVGTSQTVCINTAIAPINLATTGATGATFTGLPAGVTGSWAGNVVTISGTPTASGVFNYTVNTTGGCPPASTTGTITVTPQNTIAVGTSQTVCINTAIAPINLATTGATGATFTGLPAGVTGSWAGNVVTISGTPTVSGVFNYTVTTTGGCPPASTTGTITVTPQNTIAAGTSQTVCQNDPITPINLATTGATGATFTGLPAGVTGSWVGNVVTISGTPTVSGLFNYIVTTTGGCPPANTTGTIIVNPTTTPVTGFTYTTPVCINGSNPIPTTVPGFTTGGEFSSTVGLTIDSSSGEINLTTSSAGTYTVTYFYAATTCGPESSSTFDITILPLPTVTLTSVVATTNQSLCINTPLTNITYSLGGGATGVMVTGLPTGVSGSLLGGVYTISGNPTVSGVFNYTVTTTGGCSPAASTTGTITVTPQNTIAAGTSQTVCINTAIATINLATTTATGATFTGLPAGVTGSWAGDVVTISGTPTVSGVFNYTVTTTGGCPPATTTGTITVTPQNTIAAGTSQTVCINTAIATINLATTTATGATFSGLPAGVTGSWVGDVVTISGTPTVSGVFNYTVTTTGGCPPATTTGTITVTPQNTIAAGTSQTVCINTAITTINLATTTATGATFTGLPAGVTGSWAGNVVTISGIPTVSGVFTYTVTTTGGCPPATTTGTITVTPQNTIAVGTSQTVCQNTAIATINLATTTATGATFTGLPAGVTGSWAGNVVTISGTPTVSGVFTYTVTTTGGCPPATTTGTITVTPQNTIAAGASQTVCQNTAITTINLATTSATGATFTGLPAGVTGTWAGNVVTISGTPTVSGVFTYTVTTTGGCPPATTTGTITVTPQNTIAVGTSQTVCVNNAITPISLATTSATGATFTGLPAGVTGTWAGNVVTISGTPTVSGVFNYTVTTTGGCPPASTTGTITVTPRPVITASPNPLVLCNGATMNLVLNSNVVGTTYTWSASTTNIQGSFALSGNGTNINQVVQLQDPMVVGFVTLVVIPTANGCQGQPVTIQVVVNPVPVITQPVGVSSQTVCSNSQVAISVVGTPSGLSYTWQAVNINGVTIVGGVTSGTSNTGNFNVTLITTNPLVSGTIQFEITPIRNGCAGAPVLSPVITVNPIPGTPIGLPISEICSGENANLSISVTPLMVGTDLDWVVVEAVNVTEGYATQGSGVSPILINDILINDTNQQGFIRYRVTSRLNGCTGNTTDFIVRVNPLPKPTLQDGAICVDGSGVTFQTYVLNSGLSGTMYDFDWYFNGTLIAGATGNTYTATQPGTYSLIVTNTLTGCISEEVFANVVEVQPATAITYTVTNAFSNNATITVTVTGGTGTLLYQLDDQGFQESNVFTGVSAGPHTVTVIDTQGCTYLTVNPFVIDYPPFFTPNGDGYNDTWNIIGLQDQPEARIYIFDRYGKLLKQLSPADQKGWDGTFNGAELPSTDYWFTVEYLENEQSKVFKAHFSLIR